MEGRVYQWLHIRIVHVLSVHFCHQFSVFSIEFYEFSILSFLHCHQFFFFEVSADFLLILFKEKKNAKSMKRSFPEIRFFLFSRCVW